MPSSDSDNDVKNEDIKPSARTTKVKKSRMKAKELLCSSYSDENPESAGIPRRSTRAKQLSLKGEEAMCYSDFDRNPFYKLKPKKKRLTDSTVIPKYLLDKTTSSELSQCNRNHTTSSSDSDASSEDIKTSPGTKMEKLSLVDGELLSSSNSDENSKKAEVSPRRSNRPKTLSLKGEEALCCSDFDENSLDKSNPKKKKSSDAAVTPKTLRYKAKSKKLSPDTKATPKKISRAKSLSMKTEEAMLATPDDDVAPRRGARTKRLSAKAQEALLSAESHSDSENSDEVCDTEILKPSVLHSNEAVSGEKIFSFSNMKRKIGMIEKAAEIQNQIPKTPARLRTQLTKAIKAKLYEEEPYSDSGSEYNCETESSSESSTDSSDSDKAPRKTKPQERIPSPRKTGDRKRTQKAYIIKTDDYFSNHSSKKSVTSNHTLDKLETPRLPQDQLQKLLRNTELSQAHSDALNKLSENNTKHFSKWLYLLHENFNILLYGLGSKRNILKQFQDEHLTDDPVVVVNGFFPTLSVKDILDNIACGVLDLKELSANPYEACDMIEEEFSRQPELHMYLIIHNIDGQMLRNSKTQSVLSKLAAVNNIHLLASIDHINGPLIWDYRKLSKFNFLWWDVTSYFPYTDETAFENSLLVQKSGNLALSSLKNVFLSLTSNSKGIYLKIVEYQMEHGKNQYYQGIAFKKLYSVCREAFLVSSDLALRAQLTEFVDHKMVKFRRSADGTEYLVIPIANQLLQQFLHEQSK